MECDVLVLGGGPGGYSAAIRAAQLGAKAVCIEKEGELGGTCLRVGCIPTKAWVQTAHAIKDAGETFARLGVQVGEPTLDFAAANAWKSTVVSTHTQGIAGLFKANGVEWVRGVGRFSGPNTIAVEGGEEIRFGQAVIATGSAPVRPPIEGLDSPRCVDSTGLLAQTEVPRRLLVLGGGAIGAEMAQAMRRLGSEEVTVVEGADRLLAREEPFAGEQVADAFRAEGITVITGVALASVARDGSDGPVTGTLVDGRTIVADEILVAVGRRPNTGDLGLDAVGLEPGRSIAVDDQLRAVGVPGGWLYAVGDCNGRSLLTHMGKYQARLAGDVILGRDGIRDIADDAIVPRVTFTDPQVCAVGLTEAQARERGIPVRTVEHATGAVAGAYTLADGYTGTAKLVVDDERRVVVGATFTGPGIAELLHSATVAIAGQVTLDQLWHAVPAFPTLSEVWLRLLEAYGL